MQSQSAIFGQLCVVRRPCAPAPVEPRRPPPSPSARQGEAELTHACPSESGRRSSAAAAFAPVESKAPAFSSPLARGKVSIFKRTRCSHETSSVLRSIVDRHSYKVRSRKEFLSRFFPVALRPILAYSDPLSLLRPFVRSLARFQGRL